MVTKYFKTLNKQTNWSCRFPPWILLGMAEDSYISGMHCWKLLVQEDISHFIAYIFRVLFENCIGLLYFLFHLVLILTIQTIQGDHHPYFEDGETKQLKSYLNCPRSHSILLAVWIRTQVSEISGQDLNNIPHAE